MVSSRELEYCARFARPDIVWPLIVLSGHLLNGRAAEAEEEVVTEMLGSLVTRHRFNQSVMLSQIFHAPNKFDMRH